MGEEHRRTVRIKKALDVVYSSSSPPINARVEDLSETGMFIETSHPLEIGAELDFSLDLPSDPPSDPVRGKATVRWTDQAVGVGVDFTTMSDRDRERVKWFVAEVFFG